MAHIANRSRFRVTVKNKPDLTQHFSFSKVAAVEAYMKELRAQGYKPRAEQLDESWLVRIRERGHKPLEATFESETAATQFIEKTTCARRGSRRSWMSVSRTKPRFGCTADVGS